MACILGLRLGSGTLRASSLRLVARNASTLRMSDLPGPSAFEFNETHDRHAGNQYAIYHEQRQRFGDVMYQSASEFGADIVTLFHPEDIQKVMQREGKLPMGLGQSLLPFARFYKEHAPQGLNLGRIDGPEWLRVRKLMNKHLMAPKDGRSYLPQLARVVRSTSEYLPAHAGNVGDFLPLVTFDMISAVLLDKYPNLAGGGGSALDREFVNEARRVFPLMAEMMAPEEMPALLSGDSAIYREFEQVMLRVMSMGAEYIAELKDRVGASVSDEDPVHQSYLAKIMRHGGLDDHQMNINFSNLIFAGVDTTSNVLQWTLYHLARTPRVQDKLREEARTVLGGTDVSPASYSPEHIDR